MKGKGSKFDWLSRPAVKQLLGLLGVGGEEARINGGAVRNSLMGQPVSDIDFSTTMLPDQVTERLTDNGIKVVASGIEHGTVTAIIESVPYEITTLRADIETDGRHAVVRFGRDWREDALRRDFTINALYVDQQGKLYDPLDGLADIDARIVRFIGNAEDRIREDHLRILRFFRFFAWYGRGAPDRASLTACVRMKHALQELSAERVWNELQKLLSAPDCGRAILWMRQAGVLGEVLPESAKWGIDAMPRLIQAESDLGWEIDPLLRLMAIIPPKLVRVNALALRLKLSNRQKLRLQDWASSQAPEPSLGQMDFAKHLYFASIQGIVDATSLELARLRQAGQDDDAALIAAGGLNGLLDFAEIWQRPRFPVQGQDLIEQGLKPGKKLGAKLKKLERQWVASGFAMGSDELLK